MALIILSCAFQNMTFDQFITKFNKNYTKGSEEYAAKQKIFLVNVRDLEAKNCEACGITKFFDVAPADFEKSTCALTQKF